jgi:hypothetical protein
MHPSCEHRTHIQSPKSPNPDLSYMPSDDVSCSYEHLIIGISGSAHIMHASCEHRTQIRHACTVCKLLSFWTSNTHQASSGEHRIHTHEACMHLVNILHASCMYAPYVNYLVFWTSYTHQACMHLVNIVHTSCMYASCEHCTHIMRMHRM